MIWLVLTLLKRNSRKYAYLILGIASCLAVLVISSAGNSVLWRESRYPLRFLLGGDIMVTDRNMEFQANSRGDLVMRSNAIGAITYIDRVQVAKSLKQRFPEVDITSSVVVPMTTTLKNSKTGVVNILGRVDQSHNDGIRPVISQANWDRWQNQENAILLFDTALTDSLFTPVDGFLEVSPLSSEASDPSLAEIEPMRFEIITYFDNSVLPLTNMELPWIRGDAEDAVGAYKDWANWLCLSVPSDLLGYEKYVDELRIYLTENHPELVVYTIDGMQQMMASGFLRLEAFAELYAPLLLCVAALTLAVTQATMLSSRQREYAIYQLLGMNRRRFWLIFLLENFLLAVIGAVAGVLLSYGFCMVFFGAFVVHWSLVIRFILLILPINLLVFSRTLTLKPVEIMRSR